MDFAGAVARYISVKNALQIIALLNISEFMYPPSRINVEKSYDYVIVGGGTAGCVVANRLSENPNVTVLLIEAGGNPPIESDIPSLVFYTRMSPIDWNFTVYNELTGEYDKMNHGKVLGGTSSIDSMRFSRGSVYEYNTWARKVRDANWNWENLVPYFVKSEKLVDEVILHSPSAVFHGFEGYIGLNRTPHTISEKYINAFYEVGNPKVLDINTINSTGYIQPLYMIADEHRQSSAYSYMRSKVAARKNLDVLKDAYVTRVIFDDCKVASGVEVILDNEEKITVRSHKEVIVSAGSINTPKILMLSGIGPKKHLDSLNISSVSDLPVGENGRQHNIVLRTYKMESTNERTSKSPYESPNPVFNGFVALNKSQPYADYLAFSTPIRNNPQSVVDLCLSIFPTKEFVCKKMYDESKGSELLVNLITYFDLKSRAKVELSSADPLSPPTIRTNIYRNSIDAVTDLNSFAASILDFARVTNSTLFKNAKAELIEYDIQECRDYEFESHDYLLCYISAMMRTPYIFGTCPMGTVIDTHFRVNGVQKLRVVDSSTIPTVMRAEIIPTVIMLAEKASDLIKEKA
ncbi:unnamed protein product, partial [Iphiclides podalirius]